MVGEACYCAHCPVTPDKFRTQLARLVDTPEATADVGCFEVAESTLCSGSVFSTNCERCFHARYATGCRDCTHITQSTNCEHCHASSYCYESKHCRDSSYLAFCTNCSECDYCFGCVGLVRKDFHILNKPYGRADYFRMLKALTEALGVKLP